MNSFEAKDYLVFLGYFIVVLSIGISVTRKPKGHDRTAEDFFLASRALPWWIIGASMIASCISTEGIIGMNGTAFESGIAVISYTWLGAAIPIIIVSKFFLPAFLKMKIYSMPEFLEKRFDQRVSTGMGIFWLLVYVFVNLTSILALGAVTLEQVIGIPIVFGVIGLACFSAVYTVYGGLTSVAWTDFIQVGVLILGGIAVTLLGLDRVGDGQGIITGFTTLMHNAPEKFHTVLNADHHELPWTGVFCGGLFITAMAYWGCNQYIIQRALAAKNISQAQYGLLFAAFLFLIVSIIIVLPGVIASDLYPEMVLKRDQAFPVLIRELLPAGPTGLVVAAIIAAIISSLNSMTNSTATIFTMDIYRKFLKKKVTQKELVLVGRIVSAVGLITAGILAPIVVSQGRLFKFIQEYTGFVTPGFFAIFIFGLFWKRCTSTAALTAALSTIPVSIILKFTFPGLAFLNRISITFLVLSALIVLTSVLQKRVVTKEALVYSNINYKSSLPLNIGIFLVLGIVAALYLLFV
ncbi:sodium/solute symporter [candidate division KSB1 bacterium]|nr:sodium/solute symporter [candidate division KSB1 bacterium]